MTTPALITLSLLIVTIFASYKGLRDQSFLQKYSLHVNTILFYKDFKRLITSGFIHGSWMHLLFNMLALIAFGEEVERICGPWLFLVIYFSSLMAGSLLAVYINRNSSDYNAVGASGAISGLIFFTIALDPSGQIGFILLPIHFPAWLFGICYMVLSIAGIRSRVGNIGHEAHLGGSVAGVIAVIAIFPEAALENITVIVLLLTLPIIFFYLIFSKPDLLLVDKPFNKNKGAFNHEDRYNTSKRERERELDSLLDKINSKGIESLSQKEKDKLDNLSK